MTARMAPCPECGVELAESLALAVLDPARAESCPNSSGRDGRGRRESALTVPRRSDVFPPGLSPVPNPNRNGSDSTG